jgi:hypothetical protein
MQLTYLGLGDGVRLLYVPVMDFDQLLTRFFGTDDLGTLSPEQVGAGLKRLRLQFGLERDSERRFGLWCLMYMLGAAPELEIAFEDEEDRAAAREFVEMADREMSEED